MAELTKPNLEVQIENYRLQAMETLRNLGKKVTLAKGDAMRPEAKSYRDIYLLVSGLCVLCTEGATGNEMAVLYFSPGRVFCFLPVLEKYYPRRECPLCYMTPLGDYFVRAVEDCVLLRIDHQAFLHEFSNSLPLHTLIIQSLVEDCFDLFSHIFKSLDMPAWQRVARELLENMAGPYPHVLPRKITYSEIAVHLSIHAITVAKIFRALRDDGIIERVRSGIMIKDPLRIWRIANGEERLFYKSRNRKDADKQGAPELSPQ